MGGLPKIQPGPRHRPVERLTKDPASPPAVAPAVDDGAAEDRTDIDPLVPAAGGDPDPCAVSGEVEGLAAAADPPNLAIDMSPFPAARGDLGRLFEDLTVKRGPDGGIGIEAPPHAARALVSLFEGMARLLGAAAQSVPPRQVRTGRCCCPARGVNSDVDRPSAPDDERRSDGVAYTR